MSTVAESIVAASTTLTQPTTDWRSGLPEDLKGSPSLEKFKDIPSLAKSYTELEKMTGSAIKVPKSDKAEEWDAFYSRLGRPETPDKYEFKRPALPENVKYDEEMETAFKSMAHKAGLHPRQAQALLEGYNEISAGRITGFTKSMEEGVSKLKTEWGGSFDKNIGLATRAVKELGGDELTSMLEETGLGNHPILIKLFAKLGESMSEDTVILGDQNVQDTNSRDAIQMRINAIRNDPKHPYNDRNATHGAHEAAIREVSGLYEKLASMIEA